MRHGRGRLDGAAARRRLSWRRTSCEPRAAAALPTGGVASGFSHCWCGFWMAFSGRVKGRGSAGCSASGTLAPGFTWVGIAFFVEAERFAAIMAARRGGPGWRHWRSFRPWHSTLWPGQGSAGWHASWSLRRRGFLPSGCGLGFSPGFPWNLLGSVWSFSTALMQGAAFGGVLAAFRSGAFVGRQPGVACGTGRLRSPWAAPRSSSGPHSHAAWALGRG